MNRIQNEAIDYHELTESVRSNQSGAVALFLGTVREMTGDKRTLSLEYDSHTTLAIKVMEEIEQETRNRWPGIIGYACVHRLGNLALGEISIALAVSSPHRDVAFEACRYAMDRVKQSVPIWKKETWADGTMEWIHP